MKLRWFILAVPCLNEPMLYHMGQLGVEWQETALFLGADDGALWPAGVELDRKLRTAIMV